MRTSRVCTIIVAGIASEREPAATFEPLTFQPQGFPQGLPQRFLPLRHLR